MQNYTPHGRFYVIADTEEKQSINNALELAFNALTKAKNEFDSPLWKCIFDGVMGASNGNEVNALMVKICAMHYCLCRADTFEVVFDHRLDSYSVASTHLTRAGKTENIQSQIEAVIAESYSLQSKMVGYMASMFYFHNASKTYSGKVPIRVGNAFIQSNEFQQMHILLHEISHHACGASDTEEFGCCYGVSGVFNMKSRGARNAIRNADNIAAFVAAFALPNQVHPNGDTIIWQVFSKRFINHVLAYHG